MENRLMPRDLMIGDVVMYDPNIFIEDEYEPYHKHEVCTIQDGDDINCAFEECYYDIPLTEEILLKNGFSKTKVFRDVEGFTIPTINSGFHLGYCETDDYWMVEDHVLCRIRSVRELQHFLRLCNVYITFKV